MSCLFHTRLRALCLATIAFAVASDVCARTAHAEAPPVPPARDLPVLAAPAPPPIKLRFDQPPPGLSLRAPANQPTASGLSTVWFWIAASTTIITASIGGFEASHVNDLYDEARGFAPVAPERNRFHDRMVRAETTADVLLFGSLVLAIGTTILAFHVDWSGHDNAADERVATALQPRAAGRQWW